MERPSGGRAWAWPPNLQCELELVPPARAWFPQLYSEGAGLDVLPRPGRGPLCVILLVTG